MTDAQGAREQAAPDERVAVVSPYAGGGGGSTLGHRVATSYLADMLLAAGRPETEELPVVRLSFQTNPNDPIDDLRVEAAEGESRVVVHVAARRSPQFVKSHKKTAALIESLLDQVELFGGDERKYVAVAVTGMTPALKEVQGLASLARDNASEHAFHGQVHEQRRHAGYAGRYKHVAALVMRARPTSSPSQLRTLVWSLLSRLWLLDFRVESDDETDWVAIGSRLTPLARAGVSGGEVRNHLCTLATQFDQKGTEVDRDLLRRRAHSVLAPTAGRSSAAWAKLDIEQSSALVAVRHTLAGGLELPRTELRTEVQIELAKAGLTKSAVLITGESGTGKSALTLSTAQTLAATSSDFQCVAMNLRRVRESVAGLSSDLGMPLHAVLSEMTAPSCVLVVDAADAAVEGRHALLRELAAEARAADIGLVLVTADTAVEDVAASVRDLYPALEQFEISGLNDDELRVVSMAVPAIAGTLKNLPPRSMYRRLAVVDLLSLTGVKVTEPLGNWDCLQLVWTKLIGRATPGSPAAARTQTLLAISEEELELPETERRARVEYAALDALRTDRLVSPENLRKAEPAFAHEEVRRFATAVRLVQAPSIAEILKTSGPKRWSMSAAKLACEGLLADASDANAELAALVSQFDALSDSSTVRWRDVPLEAVLEISNAYDLLRHMVDASPGQSVATLATFVRVVSLHQRHDGMVDVSRGEPVVRLLVEETDALWGQDDEAFRLVCEWLNSALLARLPAGQSTRQALRAQLLDHWRKHRLPATDDGTPRELSGDIVYNVFDNYSRPHRRQRVLGWEITQERYIRLLALLGPDIDDDVSACLSEVAAHAPSRLQPAVDLDWSAVSVSAHDPALLLQMTEAYYIDSRGDRGGSLRNGIRHHQPRGARFSGPTRGSFWVLMQSCQVADWAPVVNRILNHAANVHCLAEDGSGRVASDRMFTLAIDGTQRTYVGDGNVWGWYRGNTGGPYPCVSALQAVERWVDRAVAAGTPMEAVATVLLKGCENLAMPALIVGAAIRHFGDDPTALDRYLVEPLIWQFEQFRAAREAIGFMRSPDDGITNPDRRSWHLPNLVPSLALKANDSRREELRRLGAELIENTARFDVEGTTIRRWAVLFDASNLMTERVQGGVLVSVKEPDDIERDLAPVRADLARSNTLLGLQNKYWIPPREQKAGWTPPTAAEITQDLAQIKELHDNPPLYSGTEPNLALAHIAAVAIRSAVTGSVEALGEDISFAITSVLGVLQQASDNAADDPNARIYESDIGTRRAAAEAIPWLLLPELSGSLAATSVTSDDVAEAAKALGRLAATDTCLSFARGCDLVWSHSCAGDPCIHLTAYQWALDLARLCEVGEFDEDRQETVDVPLVGDVMLRIPQVRPDRLDTSRLSATIRAVGRAATSSACVAATGRGDLDTLLRAQALAMAALESSEHIYFVDEHGAQTHTAARALLLRSSHTGAADALLLDYIATIAPTPHVFSSFLQDLASVGSETQELADAARTVWPTVFAHALDEVEKNGAVYNQPDAFVGYALGNLFPSHPEAAQSMYGEVGPQTFAWVRPDELVEFVPRWLPYATGRHECLLELVRFLRQLSIEKQLSEGLDWVGELCLARTDRQLVSYAPMDEWLVDIKPEADTRQRGDAWLKLVDRLVYAGNARLAAYSR